MKFMPMEEGVAFEDINEILGEYSGFENGYTLLEDGTGYIAVNSVCYCEEWSP